MDESKNISLEQSSSTVSELAVSYQQVNSVTVPFDLLWNMIEAVHLSVRQKQTLIKRLLDSLSQKLAEEVSSDGEFPIIPRDFKISQTTLAHTLGKLPKGFDFEEETEKMWEELAR